MIYISGPITGIEDLNKPLFKKVEILLKQNIHNLNDNEIINPHELNHFNSLTYRDYMINDIINFISKCDKIVMLPNWQKSKGAICELVIAKTLGMEIYQYLEIDNVFIKIDSLDFDIDVKMKGHILK